MSQKVLTETKPIRRAGGKARFKWQGHEVWNSKKFRAGALLLVLTAIVVLFGTQLAPYNPNSQDVANRLASPSRDHLLGTDELGRDVFSRVLVAARVDVGVGILGAFLPFLIGGMLGALAGYVGSWVDKVIFRVSEIVQAFPVYIFILALVAIMGAGTIPILVAYATVGWVEYCRLIRVTTRRVKGEEYIDAARLGGISHQSLVIRHMLPNATRESLAMVVLDIPKVIISLASFSYLGLGMQPPNAEWGMMIAAAQSYIRDNWWLVLAPGVCIALVGLGFLLLGEFLEERRDHG